MNRQKGQSIIEFALIVPMMIFLFLAIVYMGITFLDYTQYNNAARDMARDIALTNGDTAKNSLKNNINNNKSNLNSAIIKRYVNPITRSFITPTFNVSFLDSSGAEKEVSKAINVQVTVDLTINGLPQPLKDLNILPEKLKTLTYRMRMEKVQTN